VPVRIVVDEREKSSSLQELLRNAGAVIDSAQIKWATMSFRLKRRWAARYSIQKIKSRYAKQQTLFDQDNEIQNL
jgi:hypothetical protein